MKLDARSRPMKAGSFRIEAEQGPHPELAKLKPGDTVFSMAISDPSVMKIGPRPDGVTDFSPGTPGETPAFYVATKITKEAYLNSEGAWQVDGITSIAVNDVHVGPKDAAE